MSEPTWGLLMLLGFLGMLFLVLVAVLLAGVNRARLRGGNTPAAPRLASASFRPREGHCLECATRLPPDSPDGLCPQCLLKGGLSSAADHGPEERKRRTTPYPGPFEAPDPAELAVHFPQLEIVELIGQGGMGAVYKARQVKLDRLVALKVLPPEWGKDPAFAERFAREARTLARLNHPHIVAVHDFGESGGLYYLIMEYVDGANLREAMHAGRLRPDEALAIIPQVCDGLQYAHEEGVVHRDVKPENILLDRRGRVKIADFGLAKLLNRPRAEFTLTGSRQVMGTVDYMAPEQRSRPLEIDHRADVYALGVVFYELLTGELPLGRFAPPSERAGVDARLDEVVLRALETDPGRRYQSASEVKRDVESVVGGGMPEVAVILPAGGSRRERTDLEVALHQVRGPANALLLSGIITPLAWLALSVIMAWTSPRHWLEEPVAHGPPPIVCLMSFLISLAPAGIMIAGGLKMRRCEAYELGFIASITAMTPFTSMAWFFTLPMGLWALLVLCKRSVRDGFTLALRGVQTATPTNVLRDRVRRRLAWPAAALLVAGILQCLGQILLAFPVLRLVVEAGYEAMAGGNLMSDYRHGAPPVWLLLLSAPALAVFAAWFFLGLHVGITMIRAAVQMNTLGSYRLAVKGSFLAMIPCSPAWLVTLPAGIWAFLALRDVDVERAFAPAPARPRPSGRPALPPRRPTGPVRRKARSFLNSMLAMFVTRPGKDRPDLYAEPEADRLSERS